MIRTFQSFLGVANKQKCRWFASFRKLRLWFLVSMVFGWASAFSTYALGDAWLQEQQDENGIVLVQKQEVHIDLSDDGKIDISSEVYEEILHLRETATFFSEQSISYSSTFSEITDLEAWSLIPLENGKWKKHKVKEFTTSDVYTQGIFYDDHKKKTFYYPALKSGAKTILKYNKRYLEPHFWGSFMFSSYFPVKQSEFVVSAPKSVKLSYKLFGIAEEDLEFKTREKGGIIEYRWKANNLDKIRPGSGTSYIMHHAPHVIIHVDSYQQDGQRIRFLSGVDDLHAWYQTFLKMVKEEEIDSALNSTVDNLVHDKTTELEKVEAIYHWVQENIKYIALEDGLGGFVPRHSSTVFKRRYGDCKDMSYLLYDMLRMANIPSHLAWIGTSVVPYTHGDVPTPMADNHMICTYMNDGAYYFMDATDPYVQLGVPSHHIQGREALINKGEKEYELVDVPIIPSKQNLIRDSVQIRFEDELLTGNGLISYSGYARIGLTRQLQNASADKHGEIVSKYLEKGNNKFFLKEFIPQNIGEKDEELIIKYAFNLKDYHMTHGREIYIDPHLSKDFENAIIDLNTSLNDQYHPYTWLKVNHIEIELPSNYELAFLPEDIKFDNDEFGFALNYRQEGRHIVVDQKTFVNVLEMKSTKFEMWNQMVRTLYEAYKETIVFSKIVQ